MIRSKSQFQDIDFESLLIRNFWEMTRVWLESQKNDLDSALVRLSHRREGRDYTDMAEAC